MAGHTAEFRKRGWKTPVKCQECKRKVQHEKPSGKMETLNEAELQMD